MLLLVLSSLLFLSCTTQTFDKKISEIRAPFDDGQFDNLEPFPDKSVWDVIKWRISRKSSNWKTVEQQNFHKPTRSRSKNLTLSLIGHSSVLIQIDNINILTDPHYSDRASPISWAGPKRVIKPAIKFTNLPPIDIVLISHNHYDHLDIPTLQKLQKAHAPKILIGLGNKTLLEDEGLANVIEMDWWDSLNFNSIKIHFTPVQHWSARGVFDKRATLWGGFYIEASKKIFFAGDTGYGKVFKLIYDTYGPMDIGLIPIGAYEPRWFMKNAHINPEEAIKIFFDLKLSFGFGIHSRTFMDLTDEDRDQPVIDLKAARQKYDLDKQAFIVPEFGKEYLY